MVQLHVLIQDYGGIHETSYRNTKNIKSVLGWMLLFQTVHKYKSKREKLDCHTIECVQKCLCVHFY